MSILLVSSTSSTGPTQGAVFDTSGSGSLVSGTLSIFVPNSRAATLPNGKLCTTVGTGGPLNIYDYTPPATFTIAAQFNSGVVVNPAYELNILNGFFWGLINISETDASFYKFSDTGTIITGPIGEITDTAGGGAPFCISNDETIAYYYNFFDAIQRWDLVNNLPLSDLVSISSDWIVEAVYNVPSSTDIIVAATANLGAGNNKRYIARFTAAGGTVYSTAFYSIPAPSTDGFEEFCLDTSLDALWCRSAGPPSYDLLTDQRFMRVLFSDGSIDKTVDIPVSAGPIPGNTCFLADLTGVPDTGAGGLYFINTDFLNRNRTNDELFTSDSTTEETPIPEPGGTLFLQGD